MTVSALSSHCATVGDVALYRREHDLRAAGARIRARRLPLEQTP